MPALTLDPIAKKNIDHWLSEEYDEATKADIRKRLGEKDPELNDAFYTHLEFGTGGMRGIMGVGTNRMNVYTIAKATQGLANYIHSQTPSSPSVLIGYDSRHHSKEFAETAASVLAGNGIQVYLYQELRPTPLVSFGCRYKHCTAAIMITASHNPPQYNGYKVYWSDGGQVVPPHDVGIIAEFIKIETLSQVRKKPLTDPLITTLLEEVDDAYFKEIDKLPLYPQEMLQKGGELKIVYTSLHGTGITLMPRLLKNWGFSSVSLVEKQTVIDGDFPFAPFPNPEVKATLELGIKQMQETQSDILIATDPDADRVGVAVLHHNEPVLINGNQMACLCLDHILQGPRPIPQKGAFIKTLVTTELFRTICQHHRRPCFDVLTGFKYIAEMIRNWEENHNPYLYIFGGEESYGYLWGTQTRDKDAILTAGLIAEMALMAKLKGKTLIDLLHDLWNKYGLYDEKLLSIEFPETKEGKEKMAHALDSLRNHPPATLGGIPLDTFDDYETSLSVKVKTNQKTPLTLARSNVLIFWLEDGSKVMVRPSGTEPKVKLYCSVSTRTFPDIATGLASLQNRADTLLGDLKRALIQQNDHRSKQSEQHD